MLVCQYVGEILSSDVSDFREQFYDNQNSNYVYQISDENSEEDEDLNLTIDATFYGNKSRFINHSCEPNIKIQLT